LEVYEEGDAFGFVYLNLKTSTLIDEGHYNEDTGLFTYYLDFLEMAENSFGNFVDGQEYLVSLTPKQGSTLLDPILTPVTMSCSVCGGAGTALPCAEYEDYCTEAVFRLENGV